MAWMTSSRLTSRLLHTWAPASREREVTTSSSSASRLARTLWARGHVEHHRGPHGE
jgi:hypothetical protein